MTLCVFGDCENHGDLVPVIELRAKTTTPVASCVMPGVVCDGCRDRARDAVDLVGATMLLEIEAAVRRDPSFGGVPDPGLTRVVLVPRAQMLTPFAAEGEA